MMLEFLYLKITTNKIFGVAKKNWCEWIKFFLEAVTTKFKNIDLIERIDTLYEETIDSLRKVIGSDKSIILLDLC